MGCWSVVIECFFSCCVKASLRFGSFRSFSFVFRTVSLHSLLCITAPNRSLPYPILPCPTLPFSTLPFPTLPYPALPCPALPCPTPPYPTPSYATIPYLTLRCLAYLCALHCLVGGGGEQACILSLQRIRHQPNNGRLAIRSSALASLPSSLSLGGASMLGGPRSVGSGSSRPVSWKAQTLAFVGPDEIV